MTGHELRAARAALGLSIAEAAQHIGGVSAKSWSHFESEATEVKPDIVMAMWKLLLFRSNVIAGARAGLSDQARGALAGDEPFVTWYATLDAWQRSPSVPAATRTYLHWRAHQAAVSTVYADYVAECLRERREPVLRVVNEC